MWSRNAGTRISKNLKTHFIEVQILHSNTSSHYSLLYSKQMWKIVINSYRSVEFVAWRSYSHTISQWLILVPTKSVHKLTENLYRRFLMTMDGVVGQCKLDKITSCYNETSLQKHLCLISRCLESSKQLRILSGCK